MKKIVLFFLASFFVFTCKAGDDNNRPNGFRIGYQYSNLDKSGTKAADNLDRFYLGLTRSFKVAPLFKLETGVEFMMAGAKKTENTELELNYFSLPLQLRFKFGPFVALTGLNGNFKVHQKLTIDGTSVYINDDNRASFFDLAADVGVGINIAFITIEGRYYWGLIDVRDDWFNRYAQLGLKFNF